MSAPSARSKSTDPTPPSSSGQIQPTALQFHFIAEPRLAILNNGPIRIIEAVEKVNELQKELLVLLFNADATRVPPAPGARVPVPPHGMTGEGHLCFAASAEEIDQWKARLTTAGVDIEADFVWPMGGRSIYFRDPSGNSLEFAEPRIWNL